MTLKYSTSRVGKSSGRCIIPIAYFHSFAGTYIPRVLDVEQITKEVQAYPKYAAIRLKIKTALQVVPPYSINRGRLYYRAS